MPETSEAELDLLQRRAKQVDFYCNRHKSYDPARGGGDLYLMVRKRFKHEKVETLISYATPFQIETALLEIEARTWKRKA